MANGATRSGGDREQFWRDLIGRQQRSGLPISEFCQAEGVSSPSFFAWRKRLRLHSGRSASLFVPVEIDLAAPLGHAAPIEIALRSGTCIRVRPGCDRQTLETVLAVLEPPSC